MHFSDLSLETFLILRDIFFHEDGSPKLFTLPDKKNTQHDPLDLYIITSLSKHLVNTTCQGAPGPLINPDLVIYREDACNQASRQSLLQDASRIIALEMKKLERSRSGQIARSTGLDYNTTPPCGTIRIYDADDIPLDVRGFHLFVCLEHNVGNEVSVSALSLCDGDVLNRDFSFYLQITGKRTKGVGLGTYGDGANRTRPMLIFSNPLGAAQLDHAVTLITQYDFEEKDSRVGLVYQIGRTIPEGGQGLFFAYRSTRDIPPEWEIQQLVDPFPKPIKRETATQPRGKFRLNIRPAGAS